MNFFSSFPTKLIELVIPYAVGGPYDLTARKTLRQLASQGVYRASHFESTGATTREIFTVSPREVEARAASAKSAGGIK